MKIHILTVALNFVNFREPFFLDRLEVIAKNGGRGKGGGINHSTP